MLNNDDASPHEQLVAMFSGRLDRIGRFLGRPRADAWAFDEQLVTILGVTESDTPVALQTLLRQVPPQERLFVGDAFRGVVEHGEPAILSCRLHTDGGGVKSVLITAESTEDEPSDLSMSSLPAVDVLAAAVGPWLVGHLIDLTSLRLNATRTAANLAVARATEHRASIEQAKGIIMLAYQVDGDAAFRLLCRHSQNTNTKVHDLAGRLVAHVTDLDPQKPRADIEDFLRR